MFSGLASLVDQFVSQRSARLYIFPDAPLCALETVFQRGNPQFVCLDSQYDLVPNIDAQRLAESGGNHDSAIFIYAGSRF
jgi:hypothetical protein